MSANDKHAVRTAEVVLPAADLEVTLAFFTEELGFHVESVHPADAPRLVVVAGHGLRLRLDRDATGDPGRLVACVDGATTDELVAPNGTRISLEPLNPPLDLPPLVPSFVVSRERDGTPWVTGRAGMLYRDLLPGRQGGRFVASHIRIPEGGLVPDYVHYHEIAFQVIFCRRGRVRVVYEDQGPPFWMEPGDCVLQPPRIRHRVLECTDGLEVVEVTCPAEHVTRSDPELELPTRELSPEREFGGQRFVRHAAADAHWEPWGSGGLEARDTGIAAATRGLADVLVVRPESPVSPEGPAVENIPLVSHARELLLLFVLDGSVRVRTGSRGELELGSGDSIQLPPDEPFALDAPSADLELLAVEARAALDRSTRAGG